MEGTSNRRHEGKTPAARPARFVEKGRCVFRHRNVCLASGSTSCLSSDSRPAYSSLSPPQASEWEGSGDALQRCVGGGGGRGLAYSHHQVHTTRDKNQKPKKATPIYAPHPCACSYKVYYVAQPRKTRVTFTTTRGPTPTTNPHVSYDIYDHE